MYVRKVTVVLFFQIAADESGSLLNVVQPLILTHIEEDSVQVVPSPVLVTGVLDQML